MPERLRALVLDFDGVLVESEGLKTEVFREVFARFPAQAAACLAYHEAHLSLPRHTKFEYLAQLAGRGGDAAFLQDLAEDFSRRAIARTAACPEVPGASAFLAEFSARLPLYLASITPEGDLLEVLERRQWRRYFVEVFGYPPRPKTAAVEQAVAAAGGRRTAVALVGDAPSDLQVARDTGIEFLGRDSGLPFPEPVPLVPDLYTLAQQLKERIE